MSRLARFTRPAAAPPVPVRGARDRAAPPPGAVCELCSAPAGTAHAHLVDVTERHLLCACRACALLFTGRSGGGGPSDPPARYRTVDDTYSRIEPFTLSPAAWAALQLPVGMAFFMVHSQVGRTVVFYPSPAGATECELPLDAWADVVADNPALGGLSPDVEAALVRTGLWGTRDRTAAPTCHIVPIDRCYELIGHLRLHWRGFDGGQEVRERIAAFFAEADRRAVARNAADPRCPRTTSNRAGGQP